MSKLSATGPNAEQIRYWNEQSGPKWVRLEAQLDAQIGPIGLAAMERARIAPGERLLDVGCGCGQTSLQLAERVGPAGSVLGIDLSEAMLARAGERAKHAGVDRARFEQADAQTFRSEDRFDLLFSRFGVMFFADPGAAFANLGRALEPDGRLAFACWQEVKRNPWMLIPLLAAAKHLPLPERPGPEAPGPFSFADPERVRRILAAGGFVEIAFESLEGELLVGGGGDLDQTIDFALQLGPSAALLREAEPELVQRVREAVREAVAPHHTPEGVRLPYATWIVTGQRGPAA